MNRTASFYNKGSNGFTIVELLIVIVVIAILASITIVAFSGVQKRANATKASSAVNAYAKILKMYKQEKGVYPGALGVYGYNDICLGNISDFPAVAGTYNGGDCLYNANPNSAGGGDGHYRVAAWQTFMDAIKPYASSVSNSKLSDAQYAIETWRGIRYYTWNNNKEAAMDWILVGDQRSLCGPGSGSIGSYDAFNNIESTFCHYYLP